MLRQGGTLTKIVGSQLPNVFIIPRTVNLKYKENDRLFSCYYLQRCPSLRTNNSMPIFVFFFGCNKCRGHIALTIITWCCKCQIGHNIKRNDRNLGVNRVWYLVTKFHKNKSFVCTIFVQNLAEPAAYFIEKENILKISAVLVHDRLCAAFIAGICLWDLIERRRWIALPIPGAMYWVTQTKVYTTSRQFVWRLLKAGDDCGVLPVLGYINGQFKLVFKQKIKVKFILE